MKSRSLSRLDFELAYLVLLTRQGLKPLSRWEARLSPEQSDLIQNQGLILDSVVRRTRLGLKRTESIFSLNPRRVALYRQRFHDTSLRQTPEVVRLEGRLFGYPACCVDAFIREPYGANELAPADQELLFHWACRGCRKTPGLLREYRRIHAECRRLFGADAESECRHLPGWIAGAAKAAASLALIAGTAGIAGAQDPHWLPIEDDFDVDYLNSVEEILRGTDWMSADTDGDMVLDGVQTALLLHQLIASPPPEIEITEHMMWGLETCTVCQETVNMGYIEITHTGRGLTVELPFIALHYMEHGGLSFMGDIHEGRVDLAAIKEILLACDPAHLLPIIGDDPDEDGLSSEEEPPLEMDPADPDTDDDTLLDGPQVAESLLPLIAELPREPVENGPYLLEHRVWGMEECEVCGATVNMGVAEIVNPLEELSIEIPFVGLHTLAHGSFAFNGTVNDGQVLPTILRTILTGQGTAHWMTVEGDDDEDGLTNEEEEYFGLDPDNPDEDNSGVPDGRELAARFASTIRALPEGPLPDQTYLLHFPTYGHYNCMVCGEPINMGYLEVTDPINGTSVNVPYYNLHFMDRGGFSTDREEIYPRVDPRAIAQVLGIPSSDVSDADRVQPFTFWSAPNPFGSAGQTRIVLSLTPSMGPVEIAIYDQTGRRVRHLYSGTPPAEALNLVWDGKDELGTQSTAGIYFCKVRMGDIAISRKLTLVE